MLLGLLPTNCQLVCHSSSVKFSLFFFRFLTGLHVIACMLGYFSHVQLFVSLWTVAHQVPLSLELKQEFREEHWSGLSCSPPGNVPDPVMELHVLGSLHWQVASLGPPGKPTCARFSIKVNQAKIKLNFF